MTIPGKNGIKIKFVSLNADCSGEQHIQNPLKSPLGKKVMDV